MEEDIDDGNLELTLEDVHEMNFDLQCSNLYVEEQNELIVTFPIIKILCIEKTNGGICYYTLTKKKAEFRISMNDEDHDSHVICLPQDLDMEGTDKKIILNIQDPK